MSKFTLKKSYYLAALQGIMHLGAIIILIILTIPLMLKLLAIILCLLSWFFVYYDAVFKLRTTAIVQFWRQQNDRWCLQDRQGSIYEATLCGDSICMPFFVLLNFKTQARWRRSLMICPDAMSPDDFRRLRVQLKTQ